MNAKNQCWKFVTEFEVFGVCVSCAGKYMKIECEIC